jgi:hypothetical protein
MLYLNPPFYIIDGVSIYPDHIDPLQFYYLPVAPKLTKIKDDATGQTIPQIEIIKYRGKAGNGGFLNFDVNIGVDQNKLDTISGKLSSVARLHDKPKLAPIPVIDGSVKMMLFGMQTGDKPSTDPSKLNFVTKIDQNGKPSLYGDNQAAFSVSLDQYGVTVLDKSILGEMSPIGVVYSLDYLALRPAYSVRLHADWDRVQKHLEEKFSADSLIFSTDIDKVVDELVESRAIVIEADTFVPEGEDTGSIIKNKDQALNEVRDMVTDAFFKPSLDPVKKEEDGWDKALDAFSRSIMIASRGPGACFSYQKTDMTRIDKKTLNVNISERTTVRRSIYPQGHLSGIWRDLTNEGLKLEDFIISVDLDDPWFARRKVDVNSRANFEDDSISSINVKLTYGNEPKNVLLESSGAKGSVDWQSTIESGSMKRETTVSYKVNFKGVDGTERPISLNSPETVITDDIFEVNPRELYSIVSLPIVAYNFPWQHYPEVEVKIQYSDEPNGIRIDEIVVLDKDHSSKILPIFIRDSTKRTFRYRVVYHAADNRDVDAGWVDTGEEQVSVRDPFPMKRTVEVVPNLNWNDISQAFVDLTYEDHANNILEDGSLSFSPTDMDSKRFTVDLANPDLRLVTYQVTVLFKDGRSLETPKSLTRDKRIIIRSDMKGHRIIFVHTQPNDFDSKNLKEISVEQRYEDPAAGLRFNDIFTFKSPDDKAYFEFDYVDDQRSAYSYKVTYSYTNGLSRTEDWKNADTGELIIPVA